MTEDSIDSKCDMNKILGSRRDGQSQCNISIKGELVVTKCRYLGVVVN